MPTYIELHDFLTPQRLEEGYRRSLIWQSNRSAFHADKALGWAKTRNYQLLRGLNIWAEHLQNMQVQQGGGVEAGNLGKVDYTEYTLVKNALVCADQGLSDMHHYTWVYAAAAWAVGLFPG